MTRTGEAGLSVATQSEDASEQYTSGYRKYALFVLLLGYIVNFVDRSILSILIEPIKADLQLNDTQLGLLGGLAFAVFYSTLGIPIAALADRWSRVKVLSIAIIIWSAMTAVCGLVSNFWQLLFARIGVGVGEAGASPPSHSLISDYFPLATRATALSIYALGIPIGTMVGNAVGGWGADNLGWRYTFMLVGLPGVAIALLLLFTLREPPRGLSDTVKPQADEPPPSMGSVLQFLWRKRSFQYMSLACGLHAFVGYGSGTWNAPFLVRIHELSNTETGAWLALIAGIGAIGTFGGGYLADKLYDASDNRRWYLWIPAIATLIMVPFQLLAYLHSDLAMVVTGLIAASILGPIYLGPSFAMTQALVGLRMRAVASAILLLVLNLVGMGLGPYFVGFMSDVFEPSYEIFSLRYALCVSLVFNLVAAFLYYLSSGHVEQDIADTEALSLERSGGARL